MTSCFNEQMVMDELTSATLSFDQLIPITDQNGLSHYEIPKELILYRTVTAKMPNDVINHRPNDVINHRPNKKYTFIGDLECAMTYFDLNHQKIVAYGAPSGLKLLNMSDPNSHLFIKNHLNQTYGTLGKIISKWLDHSFSNGKYRTSTVEIDDYLMNYLNIPEFDGIAIFGMKDSLGESFHNEMAIWNLNQLKRDHLPPEKVTDFIKHFQKIKSNTGSIYSDPSDQQPRV